MLDLSLAYVNMPFTLLNLNITLMAFKSHNNNFITYYYAIIQLNYKFY